jgi:hypothetical protein
MWPLHRFQCGRYRGSNVAATEVPMWPLQRFQCGRYYRGSNVAITDNFHGHGSKGVNSNYEPIASHQNLLHLHCEMKPLQSS